MCSLRFGTMPNTNFTLFIDDELHAGPADYRNKHLLFIILPKTGKSRFKKVPEGFRKK